MLFQNLITSTPIKQPPELLQHRLGIKTVTTSLIDPISNTKFVKLTDNNTIKTKITIRNRIKYNTYK